jgi:hypothetical protein
VNECISYQNLFDATKAWKEYDISFGLSDYMLKRKEGFAEMLQLGIVISADYEDKMWYELGSTRSANKPYIKITHEPLTPTVSAMSPSANSTSARSSPITFNWSHGYDVSGNGALLVTPIQKSAKLRYRVTGAGSYTEKSITGATNSYTIPANTLTTDSSEWQVVITDDNNRTVTSAWVQFNSPQAPGNPTILYPNKTAIDTTRENTFAWQHNFIAPQDAAQIEFDYGYITETVDIGSAQSYTAPANSLSWGNSFKWRVRTQSNTVWGGWSEAQAALLAPLPEPAVSFSGATPKTTINFAYTGYGTSKIWYAFRVKCGNYDSGVLTKGTTETVDGSTVTSAFALPAYLNAGANTVQVQCCDANGKWSTWAQATTTIVNTSPASITLTAAQSGNAVSLMWGENAAFTAYYIFRDGIMIGKTVTGTYVDNFAGQGEHVYKVRGVDGTNYADGNEVTATVALEKAILTTVDSIDWLTVDILSDGTSGYSLQASGDVTLNYYQGRQKPVPSFQDFRAIVRSFPCAFRNSMTFLQDIDKFIDMLDKVVFMALPDGVKMFGVIQAPSFIPKSTAEFSFKVIETDYSEAISYE